MSRYSKKSKNILDIMNILSSTLDGVAGWNIDGVL